MKGKPLIEVLTHGGKRPGAGRKPGNPRRTLSVRLSEPAMAKLNALRKATSMSAGRIVEGLLENDPQFLAAYQKAKAILAG